MEGCVGVLMSDIVIVSKDQFVNGHAPDGHVPYGSILVDDEDMVESDSQSFESMYEGAVLAVDWRGVDQVDTEIGPIKRKPGRPRKAS